MSLLYRIFYRVGFTPWEEGATEGPAFEQIARLFEREERGRQQPYGPALDLGCGSGIWSVILAQRGWQVTGIDIVPRAVRRACERAKAAGVAARFVCGDVTALRSAGIECGYRETEAVDSLLEEFTPAGPQEILVHPSDLDAARELLAPPTG